MDGFFSFNKKKSTEAETEAELIYKEESIQRIKAHFKAFFHQSGILSETTRDAFIDNEDGFNYLIDTPLPESFAIVVCSILPPPKGIPQVFYNQRKKKLMAKKGNFKTYEVLPDIINDEHGSLFEQAQRINPELVEHLPISIIVLANPIKLSSIPNNHCQRLDKERYFYIDGIYIVEESKLDNLMTALILSKPIFKHPTTSPSQKKAPLSKPVPSLKKPSSKTQINTQDTKQAKSSTQTPNVEISPPSVPITENTYSLSEAEENELIRRIFPHLKAYITFMLTLYFLLRPQKLEKIGLFSLCFFRTTYGKNQSYQAGRMFSLAIQEEAVYRTYCLLHEKFSYCGMKIYARWNYPDESLRTAYPSKRPDIIFSVPPNLVYVIAVKSLVSTKDKTVKIFYDTAVETLRYRKGNRGKQNFIIDPIYESNKRANWLLKEHSTLVPNEPIQIIVFAEPIDLKLHPKTPTESFAKRKTFIHHNNVYIVKENKLVSLIRFLTPKDTPRNPPKNS